jgi:hypothetical protein
MKRICVRGLKGYEGEVGVEYVGRRCGRWNGSVLGNKWKIGIDGDREMVVEKYRRWLWEMIKKNDEVVVGELGRLLEIGDGLVIGCWCDENERCHGDVILNCLKWMK